MDGYSVAHVDEIEMVDDGRNPWRAVRHHFGITAFGVNAFTGHKTGDRVINEHDEAGEHEELYLVLRGRAVFELDGERLDAPIGRFVSVAPGVKRTAFAEESDTVVVVVGGQPGEAYEPDGWEIWAPLQPLYASGEYDALIEHASALVESNPQYPGLVYNLACCESLAGRTADAVEHLRQAIDKRERFREVAKGDSDFDRIRDEPAFEDLVGV